MSASPHPHSWRPVVTAFSIWFIHFMVCWAAVEIWPQQWAANLVAWVATAVALLAIAVHAYGRHRQQQSNGVSGDVARWQDRFAQGAIAISTIAVLFSAVPSMVFLP